MINIISGNKTHYLKFIEIWQSSVLATHHFLQQSDIDELRPLILEHYFDAVQLKCAINDDGKILGFIGVAKENIEMLFIDPCETGKGIGRQLTQYAIAQLNTTKVDVNEQNPNALGFYQHLGFAVKSRSELDGQGKPFPLLHMALTG